MSRMPTDVEKKAMEEAGYVGGEYLEHIGKSDLRELSPEEYATLIEAICATYEDQKNALALIDDAQIPF